MIPCVVLMKMNQRIKIMKYVLFLAAVVMMSLNSCKKCKNEDPRARIVNNGTQTVSAHIQTSGGNTININNIDAGQTSSYQSYSPGSVTFTISVGNGNQTQTYSITQNMETCYEYEIAIDANNNLTSTPTDRNE